MTKDLRDVEPRALADYIENDIKNSIDELAKLKAYDALWEVFDYVLFKMPKTEAEGADRQKGLLIDG